MKLLRTLVHWIRPIDNMKIKNKVTDGELQSQNSEASFSVLL